MALSLKLHLQWNIEENMYTPQLTVITFKSVCGKEKYVFELFGSSLTKWKAIIEGLDANKI